MARLRPAATAATLVLGLVLVWHVASGRSSAQATIELHPGSTAAQAVALPVAAGPRVEVTVTGLLVQKTTGNSKCWDAFYYNDCGSNWQGNGVVNSIWLVPPGWQGDLSSVVLLSTVAGSTYPAFVSGHDYKLALNLTGKSGWSLFAAATIRGGTLADWSGAFTLSFAGGAPAGGPTPKVAPTGKVPFGTPVTVPYSLGGVVEAPSPTLPAATSEVDLSAQATDAEIDQFIAVLKLALAAYNRKRTLAALANYCLVFIPQGDSQSLGLNNFGSGDCDKIAKIILAGKKRNSRRVSAASAGCLAAVVPIWKPGASVTAQQRATALATARSEVHASCARGSGRLSLKVTAVGSTTLYPVLGASARAGVGAHGNASGTPQLTLTWAPPHTRSTPPGGKAKPGHYTGQTSSGDPVSFDVTANGAGVTNLKAAGHVTCTDQTGWTWTITSSSTSPVSAGLAFSRTYSGSLTVSDTSISNLNVAYTLAGTLTTSGTGRGSFRISHITWDQSGTHYDCTGAAASWTARTGG